MGIDTPAFTDGVQRPVDSASSRGEIFTEFGTDTVAGPAANTIQIHQNNSGSIQFAEVVNMSQSPGAGFTVQPDTSLKLAIVGTGGFDKFVLTTAQPSIVKVVPSLTIQPNETLEGTTVTESSGTVSTEYNISIRNS
jgi:hypothetical protein